MIEFLIADLSFARTVSFYEERETEPSLILGMNMRRFKLENEKCFVQLVLETFACSPADLLIKNIRSPSMEYRVRLSPISYAVVKDVLVRLANLNYRCVLSKNGSYVRLWEKAVEWEELR